MGSSFEAAMSSVASISGATGQDFTDLETKAKQMGATTAFSATEAANAMEYMAMAGWKTTDMVSGIDGIMNLAAASGADLAQTSDIVTDGLTAFGMSAGESSRFANVMAAASSNANTNVEMMGETFKYVGAAAGAMGYSIEDMAVATGLMANAGIKGSQAGTALRSTITRMAKPTKESQTAMDALGMSVTRSDGSMKSFAEVMTDMRTGMQGMTEDQKASYAAMLGGQEAMSGLLAIANASDKDFQDLTTAIAESSTCYNGLGAAAQMAAVKLDNLQGDVTILKSGLEGLGIAIYDNIKGPLRSVTQTATKMVGSLSDALTNGGFSAFVAQLGNVLGQAVTMVASYAPQVVSMGVQLIQGFLSGIQANSGAIASGAASTIAAFINGLLVLIPQVIMIGGQLILQFVQGMIPQIPQLLTAATQAINTLVQGFISGLPMILQTATQLIMSLVQGIVQNAPMLIASAVQAITAFLSGILQMLPVILQAGVQLILGLAQGIISNIPLILQSAVLLIQQFVTGLTQMLPTIIQGGIQLVISLIQGIISNLGTIAQAGVQIIVSLVTGLIQAIPMIIAAIPQLISAIIDTIFNTDWIAVGGEIINGIKDGFMSGFTSLVDSVKGLWSDFTGWLFGDGEEAGSAAGDGVASGVTSSSGNVASAASQTTQTATQNFQFDYGVLEGYGQQATNSVANGLNTGSGTLNYSAAAVGTNTSNSILSGMQTVDLASGGTQATNSILAGLNTGGVQLTTTATTLGTETATNLNNSLLTGGAGLQATASQLGTDTINSLSTSFNNGASTLDLSALQLGTNTTSNLTTGLTNGTATATSAATNVGTQVGTSLTTGLDTANAQVAASTQQLSQTLSTGLTTSITDASTQATTAINEMGTNIGTALTSAVDQASTQATTAVSTLGTNLGTALTESLTTAATGAGEAANNIGTQVGTSLTQGLSSISASASMAATTVGTSVQTALTTSIAAAGTAASATALTAGTTMIQSLVSGITGMTPTAVSTANSTGLQTVQGLALGILAGTGTAVSAAQTVVNAVTATFNSINLHSAGYNAAAGFASGLASGAGAIYAQAQAIASTVRSTIQSALQIHSPSRVMMKIGQYTGEGMAIGIEKMVGQVQSASEQLANGITAPVTYSSGNSPVQEVQSTLSDVPALAGNIPVSPTGSSKAETLKKEIKLVIEKIILNDTGDKDKKQLVKELLEELIEELKGADEVISSADLGVLL